MRTKFINIILILVLVLSVFVSCTNETCIVTFDMNDHGEEIQSQIVKYGKRIQEPETPTEEGYVFYGWYTDLDFIDENKWYFDTQVTSNMTLYANWLDYSCLAKGTLITMADGTKKAVETLKEGDLIRVFDHTTGQLSSSEIMDLWHYDEPLYGLITLHFSNDIDIRIVSAHAFYCQEEKNYVCINANNAKKYIGKHFYNADNNTWVTLKGATASSEKVETYFLATRNHFNCVAEGLLNVEDGLYFVICSTFEYDNNMKIDQAKKNEDILKYGLFGYDDFKYLTKEEFASYYLAYLKVAIGKGIMKENSLALLESVYTSGKYEE